MKRKIMSPLELRTAFGLGLLVGLLLGVACTSLRREAAERSCDLRGCGARALVHWIGDWGRVDLCAFHARELVTDEAVKKVRGVEHADG